MLSCVGVAHICLQDAMFRILVCSWAWLYSRTCRDLMMSRLGTSPAGSMINYDSVVRVSADRIYFACFGQQQASSCCGLHLEEELDLPGCDREPSNVLSSKYMVFVVYMDALDVGFCPWAVLQSSGVDGLWAARCSQFQAINAELYLTRSLFSNLRWISKVVQAARGLYAAQQLCKASFEDVPYVVQRSCVPLLLSSAQASC